MKATCGYAAALFTIALNPQAPYARRWVVILQERFSMKILSIEKSTNPRYFVETDQEDFPHYITDGNGNWERVMGESVESWYASDLLEMLFQKMVGNPTPNAPDLPETWAENQHPSMCIHRQGCIHYKPANR